MGLGTLAQVLRPLQERFRREQHPEVIVGLDVADDAAVIRVSDELALVQTLDFFPPVVDDPFTYGQIAAVNAMSGIYAMGGEVWIAMQISAFPQDLDPLILAEIFRGGADKVAEAGGVIVGGHTIFDVEPKYGLSVTGVVHPDAVIRTGGGQPGDALLLTKPIGTGVLMTAAKQQRRGHDAVFNAAVTSMLTLNRHPAHLASAACVHAMTDVTGFGLLGHAAEVAEASQTTVVIEAAAVPLLPGALEFARDGAVTGGGARNREQLGGRIRLAPHLDASLVDLLHDPQTSGGLLIAVAETDAEGLRGRIEAQSGHCWRVGSIEAGPALVDVR